MPFDDRSTDDKIAQEREADLVGQVGGEGKHVRRPPFAAITLVEIGALSLVDNAHAQFGTPAAPLEDRREPGLEMLRSRDVRARIRDLDVYRDSHCPRPPPPVLPLRS